MIDKLHLFIYNVLFIRCNSAPSLTNTQYMKKHIKKLFVVDCGKNESTVFDGHHCPKTGLPVSKKISHDSVLDLHKHLSKGDWLVSEYSHLGVRRTQKSLSQPFTENQLLDFYTSCKKKGIILKLFPQKSTPTAIYFAKDIVARVKGLDPTKNHDLKVLKSDETDPIAIYYYIMAHENISLMNPPLDFEASSVRQEGWSRKSECTELCNQARSYHYIDDNSDWIRKRINEIADRLSPQAQSCFGLEVNIDGLGPKTAERIKNELGIDPKNLDEMEKACKEKKLSSLIHGVSEKKETKFLECIQNKTIKEDDIAMSAIYAILSTLRGKVVNNEGDISTELYRRQSTGDLPGWYFVKRYVLCFSPFHLKGGTARSNLYHHSIKSWIKEQAKKDGFDLDKKQKGQFSKGESEVFLKYRRIYAKACKELFVNLKNMVQE